MKMLRPRLQQEVLTPAQWFMISTMVVNAGNYVYNIVLGRILGPAAFADAAIVVTLLLVLSFIGMTFQLAAAKYAAGQNEQEQRSMAEWLAKLSLLSGFVLGVFMYGSASFLQSFFHTETDSLFKLMSLGVPLYFYLSVNRGLLQGNQQFIELAKSYQAEMWLRVGITILLILLSPKHYILWISLAIIGSLLGGAFPRSKRLTFGKSIWKLNAPQQGHEILTFMGITAFYELTQIAINHGDLLLVKHYFPNTEAGAYAGLAMIGRVVYFITWMLAMILIPEVVKQAKEGTDTRPLLMRYLTYTGFLGLMIVAVCYFFPNLVVGALFGEAFQMISPLLWKYALATTFFALANIFSYYHLALNLYKPVILAGIFALCQVAGIALFHNSLEQVVHVQMTVMAVFAGAQLLYFLLINPKSLSINHSS